MKKSLKLVFISTLVICLLFLIMFLYDKFFNKNDQLIVTSAVVFGHKIKLIEGQYIYEIFLESGEIKDISGGCEDPFVITTNHGVNIYGTGGRYYSDDLKEATLKIGSKSDSIKTNWQQSFSYKFSVYFDNPIKVSDRCNPRSDLLDNR